MVISFLQPDRGVDARCRAGFGQAVGLELFDQELIGCPLIDEDVWMTGAILNQCDCIIGAP